MRIYLDMCSVQRPMDDHAQLRVRLEAEAVLGILALCDVGTAELLDSEALRWENAYNPSPIRRSFAEEALDSAKDYISATGVIERRADGCIQAGMKPIDALHLASAVEAGASYFCTCDDKLLRRAKQADTAGTRAISPLELIEEMEG
jgi:predicted nucleic acid-binding protein